MAGFQFTLGQKVFALNQPADQERVVYTVACQATDRTGHLYLCETWNKLGQYKELWFRPIEIGAHDGGELVTKQSKLF